MSIGVANIFAPSVIHLSATFVSDEEFVQNPFHCRPLVLPGSQACCNLPGPLLPQM